MRIGKIKNKTNIKLDGRIVVYIDITNKSTNKLLTMIYETGKVVRYKGIKIIKSIIFLYTKNGKSNFKIIKCIIRSRIFLSIKT